MALGLQLWDQAAAPFPAAAAVPGLNAASVAGQCLPPKTVNEPSVFPQ